MHDETRGVRYFSMHRLTGAKLEKLIAVKLVDSGMPGFEKRYPALRRRRILSETDWGCQPKKRVKVERC